MNFSYDEVYTTALHESCHLLVTLKLTEDPSFAIIEVLIRPHIGHVLSRNIYPVDALELCIGVSYAAGIACEDILKRGRHLAVNDLAKLEAKFPDTEIQDLLIAKTRGWLQSKWSLVERIARNLVCNLNTDGPVNKRSLKHIVGIAVDEIHKVRSAYRATFPLVC